MNFVDYLLARRKVKRHEKCARGLRAAIEVSLIKIPCRLTANTIHLHIFYFSKISPFFGTK